MDVRRRDDRDGFLGGAQLLIGRELFAVRDGLGFPRRQQGAQTQGVTVTSPPPPLAASASSPRAAADVGQAITVTFTRSGRTAPYKYDLTFRAGKCATG